MPIFDQGYQHWNGRIGGHTWRWLAVTRHGIRTQMSGSLMRVLLIVSWLPAVVLAAVLSIWGLIEQQSDVVAPILSFIELPEEISSRPTDYRVAVWTLAYHYFFQIQIFFSMIVVLVIGPGLISKDLRFNAMPLYLSRPLTRLDYFLGKLGVIVAGVGAVSLVPAVIAYLLGILFSLDPGVIGDTWPLFLGVIAFGVVIALSAGMLMLGLSALSRNSRYVALFWVGVWFLSSTVSGVLSGINMVGIIQQSQAELEAAARSGDFEQVQLSQESIERRVADAVRDDWRPMIAYTGNLYRLEAALLDTNPAWEKIGSVARNPFAAVPEREPAWVTRAKGPQFPWYWSAGVLLGLMGGSAWILHSRVRSLDRLR